MRRRRRAKSPTLKRLMFKPKQNRTELHYQNRSRCTRCCDFMERYVICFVFTAVLIFTIQTALWFIEPDFRKVFSLSQPVTYYVCGVLYFHFFLTIYMTPPYPNAPRTPWNRDGKNCVVCEPLKRKQCVEDPKFCGWCFIHKTPQIHHCSSCGRCVENLDHHCQFMGTCIDDRNYRHFFLSLIWIILSTGYCACAILYMYFEDLEGQCWVFWGYIQYYFSVFIFRNRRTRYQGPFYTDEWSARPDWFWTCVYLDLFVCSLVVGMIGKLLYTQLKMTWNGTTMFEYYFSRKIENKNRPKGLKWLKQRLRSTGKYWWLCFFIPGFGEWPPMTTSKKA